MPRNPSPGEPDCPVEHALNEVIEAVREGADPLEVDDTTVEGLKRRYRPDFKKQHQKGAEWHRDRDTVLPLACRIGAMAMVLTLWRWLNLPQDEPAPKNVDPESTYLAAYVVAKRCPKTCSKTPQSDYQPRGAYCPSMFISRTGQLEEKLAPIFSTGTRP